MAAYLVAPGTAGMVSGPARAVIAQWTDALAVADPPKSQIRRYLQ